jgi:hypothetical protein
MLSKIILVVTAILTAGVIGAVIYIKNQPKPVSGCDILLTKMLEAKTEAEHSFAEKRWTDVCVTNGK